MTEINSIIQETLTKLKNQKSNAVTNAVAKNRNEVVVPRFSELESAKNKAVAQVNAEYDAKFSALTKEKNEKIANLAKETADAKTEFESAQKEAVTASVSAEFDTKISKLEEILKD